MKRAKEIDKYLAAQLKTLDKHKVAGFEKAEDMKLFCDFLQKENIPFEHNSNGKGEPDSRSYNGAGAKINWRAEYENWSFKSYFKGLYRYALDRTNHDYEQYVGPFEMGFAISQFSYHWIDRGELTYRVYTGGDWGQKFDRTSHEVGLSFRIFGSRLTPAFYVQYFNGYSESLLNYNKREENFRVGFIL
jgi:phospholipase A1